MKLDPNLARNLLGRVASRGALDIVERVPIPDELVPADAQVEMVAKKAAGYYSPEAVKPQDVTAAVGRSLDKY